MRTAVLDRPVLHGGGDLVGDLRVERFQPREGAIQSIKHRGREAPTHVFAGKSEDAVAITKL